MKKNYLIYILVVITMFFISSTSVRAEDKVYGRLSANGEFIEALTLRKLDDGTFRLVLTKKDRGDFLVTDHEENEDASDVMTPSTTSFGYQWVHKNGADPSATDSGFYFTKIKSTDFPNSLYVTRETVKLRYWEDNKHGTDSSNDYYEYVYIVDDDNFDVKNFPKKVAIGEDCGDNCLVSLPSNSLIMELNPQFETKLGFMKFCTVDNVNECEGYVISDPDKCITANTFFDLLTAKIEKYKKGCNYGKFADDYNVIINACSDYEKYGYGKYTASACAIRCQTIKDEIAQTCGYKDANHACGSLSGNVVKYIYRIIKIVRYAIPALLIILSILDFIKAIASDSDDEMKKVINRFVKRLIAALLIFVIPFILEFILNAFNLPGLDKSNPFCK